MNIKELKKEVKQLKDYQEFCNKLIKMYERDLKNEKLEIDKEFLGAILKRYKIEEKRTAKEIENKINKFWEEQKAIAK